MPPLSPTIPKFCYFLQKVRRTWVAARDDDERKRLLKEEEGLAVRQLPKAAPELMRRCGTTKHEPTRSQKSTFEENRAHLEVDMYAHFTPSVCDE